MKIQHIELPPPEAIAAMNTGLSIERAPSSKSRCQTCMIRIQRGDVRLHNPMGSQCRNCASIALKRLMQQLEREKP